LCRKTAGILTIPSITADDCRARTEEPAARCPGAAGRASAGASRAKKSKTQRGDSGLTGEGETELSWLKKSSEQSVKIPQVALLPKMPFRTGLVIRLFDSHGGSVRV